MRTDRAVQLDREGTSAGLAPGRRLPYDHAVPATGTRPPTLPVPGAELSGVLTLHDLADAQVLRRRLTARGPLDVVVAGAGFIGMELAATAREAGHRVTVVEALPRVMARAVTPGMSDPLVAAHRDQGVRVELQREPVALRGDARGQVRVVEPDGGERLPADLAVAAGLRVGDGIVVDEDLRTSDSATHTIGDCDRRLRSVTAIGDCARFPSPHAGRHLRLESVQNAADQARSAAAALCGQPERHAAVPCLWTKQYGLRLQIAGITAGHDRTMVAGDVAGDRLSVFC